MENKKEYCESLYNKYKELKKRTELEARDVKPCKVIEGKYIDIKDIEEYDEAKKKLHKCLNFLTDEQLKKLNRDSDFMGEAIKILAERKINNQLK